MAEHWRNQARQTFDDQGHHRLTAAPAPVGGSAHVQTVFGDIEVKVGEVSDAEVLQQLEETEKLIALEGFRDLIHHLGGALQHPSVQQRQVLHRDGIGGGTEVVQIAEQVSARVAHFPVDVRELTQDSGADGHIGGVIHRAHPESQHISAVSRLLLLVFASLDNHHRINDIAEGFAHLSPLLVESEPMGEHALVGGMAMDGHGGEQRALEPAAVLIGSFEVKIGGVAERVSLARHGSPAGSGVEPHVHGVGAFAPLIGLVGVGRWQQSRFVVLPPNVAAVGGDQSLDMAQGVGVEQHLVIAAVIEHRDRYSPGALAGDAPVPPLLHHRFDSVAA